MMFSLQAPKKCRILQKHQNTLVKRRNIKVQICQASLNPYKALGVEADAKDSDIKKAYKKLVLRYHPDVSAETNAETRFKEIQRAYEILMGKDSDSWSMEGGGEQRKGWDFHDWYWSFSMKQRRAKKQGYVEPKVDLQTEEKKTQVRSQLAGLKQRAAQRRQQRHTQTAQQTVQSAIREDQASIKNGTANKTIQPKEIRNPTQQQKNDNMHVYYWNVSNWKPEDPEQTYKNRSALRYLGVLGVMITTSFQSFPNSRLSDIKGRIIDVRSTMCAEHKQLANNLISIYFKPYLDAFALFFSGYGDMSMEEEFNQVLKERLNLQTQPTNNNTSVHQHEVNQDLQYSYYTSNLQYSDNNNNVNVNSQYNYFQENVQNEEYSRQSSAGFRSDTNQVRSQLAGLKRKATFKQNRM